jgi:hypothetical protein
MSRDLFSANMDDGDEIEWRSAKPQTPLCSYMGVVIGDNVGKMTILL